MGFGFWGTLLILRGKYISAIEVLRDGLVVATQGFQCIAPELGSSSKSNTPPWARLTSLGRGIEPLPIRPAVETPGWGLRLPEQSDARRLSSLAGTIAHAD